MIETEKLCMYYNAQVELMIKNNKRLTKEQCTIYAHAFASKKAIEHTLDMLGLMFDFDTAGNAIGIVCKPIK